jgi:DNA invertase Pin-like site-specific DNA recombinase
MTTTATQAVKYRRISDDREGRELGVTRQDEDLNGLADRLGLRIVGDYCDNDTGASTRSMKRRPDYERMIVDAKAGKFSVVVAYTSSRLTRRPRDWEDLIDLYERHGVRYRFVSSPEYDLDTADGRMTARIAASVDAAESERISERVSRKRQQHRRSGTFGGGTVPWWLKVEDQRLVHDPHRVELVRELAQRVSGGESQAAVCRDWNNSDVPPPSRAAEWSSSVTSAILRNRLLLGDTVLHTKVRDDDGRVIRVDKTVVTDDDGVPIRRADPVLTRVQWDALQNRLTATGSPRTNQAGTHYLLTGIAFCGGCGAVRHNGRVKMELASGPKVYTYSTCSNRRCRSGKIRLGELEEYVTRAFLDLLGDAEVVEPVHHAAEDHTAELEQATEAWNRLQGEMEGKPPAVQAVYRDRIAKHEATIARLSAQPTLPARVEYAGTGVKYGEVWETSTDLERRKLLLNGGFKVEVAPGGATEKAAAAKRLGDRYRRLAADPDCGELIGHSYGDAPFVLMVLYPPEVAARLSSPS